MSPTATPHHAVRDELAAEIDLATDRLQRFDDRLDCVGDDLKRTFGVRSQQLGTRASGLRKCVLAWPEARLGTVTAVDDLSDAIDALELDLAAATADDTASYRRLVDRQIRAWRARGDRLRLQVALGRLEARDELDEATTRLDRLRGEVLLDLREALDDARDIVIDVRDEVEETLGDVRQAVERAIDTVVRN